MNITNVCYVYLNHISYFKLRRAVNFAEQFSFFGVFLEFPEIRAENPFFSYKQLQARWLIRVMSPFFYFKILPNKIPLASFAATQFMSEIVKFMKFYEHPRNFLSSFVG